MSYAGHKSRIFRDDGDIPEVIRRRSEGRLKSYPSTQDARAWTNDGEERRQQILDLINSDIQKCSMGKYVPIDVLINTLLANKNADAARLKNQVDALQKLLDMYSKLDLTEDQKRALAKMKQEAGGDLESIAAGRSPKGSPRDDREKCAAVKREREGSSCSALQKAGQTKKEKDGKSCAALEKMGQGDLRALVVQKDAEITALKNELGATKAELAAARDKSQTSKTDAQVKGPDKACIKEIEGLEAELQRLKSKGQLSADDEAEIIRKEIEVLKRYCTKLSTIEEENKKLRNKLEGRDSSPTVTTSSALTPDDDLRMELNSKIAKLNEVVGERDRLKNRIDVLEGELIKYTDLPKEIKDVKRKAETIDTRSIKSADKATEVDNAQDVQREIETLKKKASEAGELQSKLDNVNKEIERVRRESAAQIEELKLKHEEMTTKRQFETNDMHKEIKCLSKCAQEAKSLRCERDDLKKRLAQLSGLETQFKKLQEKVKYLESIKKEREMYKMRYEELLGLECQCEILKAQVDNFKNIDQDREGLIAQLRDCECCIADQEEEIKRLIAHIDRMSDGCNEQQGRMQKEILSMKAELHQKNALISKSEERLACVQEQLRNTIKGVTCETSCLRKRILELEQELALVTKTKASRSRKGAPDSDEHFNEMLRQSRHAVKRVSEELEKHYKEWDSLKGMSVTTDQEIYDKYANEKRTNAELLKKIDTLQGKLDESNALNTKLANESQKEYEQLKVENTSLRRYSTEIQASANDQIKDLINALDDAHKQISQLVLENKELNESLKQCKEKPAQPVERAETQVSGEIDAIIDQNKQLLKDKLTLENEIDTLKQQLENYKKQLDRRVSGDNERQMQEKLCMQDIIRQLQAQIAAMEARDLDSQLRVETAVPTRERDSTTESPTLIGKQLQIQPDSKSAAVEADTPASPKAMPAPESLPFADSEDLISKLRDQLEKERARAESAESSLRQLKGADEQITDSSDIIAKLKSQLEQEKARANSAEANFKELQQKYESRVVDAAHKGDVTEKTSTAERGLVTDDDAQLKSELTAARARAETSEATLKHLQATTESSEAAMSDIIANLKSQLKQAEAKIEDLEAKLKHAPTGTAMETDCLDEIAKLKAELEQEKAKSAKQVKVESQSQTDLQKSDKELQTKPKLEKVEQRSRASGVLADEFDDSAKLKSQLEKANARANASEATLKELQAKIGAKRTRESGVETDFQDETAKLKSQLEKANARADTSQANFKALQAKVGPKRTRESGVATDSQDVTAKLKSQLEKANARAESSEANLKALQAKMGAKRTRDSGVTTSDLIAKGTRGRGSQTDKPDETVALKAKLEKANARANVSEANLKALQAKVDAQAAKPKREGGVVTDPIEKPRVVGATETEAVKVGQAEMQTKDVVSKGRTMQTAEDPVLEESKEKIKKLEDKNRDLTNAQQKSMNEASALRRASKEAEESHADQIRRLSQSYEDQLRKSQVDLERASAIKNYQEKEIKNLHKRYSDGIAKLQGSHEEVIKEINVEHEKEVDILRSALRASKEVIADYQRRPLSTIVEETSTQKVPLSSETVEGVTITPSPKTNVETSTQGDRSCKCIPSLKAIAKKILRGGMEVLDFVDLKMLHEKTCEATAALLRTSAIQWGPCMCQPRINNMQLPEDKQILLTKINSLENELFKKQKHTQQKIGALQISVKMERERLQEFKALLDTERNRNNELMCKIGAQSRIVASMQAERDMMRRRGSFNEEKMQSLLILCEQENAKIRQLEEDLNQEREMRKRDVEELQELQRKQYSTPRGCHCNADCRCKQQTLGQDNQPVRQSTEMAYHVQPQYSPRELINRQTFTRQCGVKQICSRRRGSLSPETKIKSPADLEDID
ncbi:nuclear anchorage protein 1-like [Photinus pyralis]|nr:nuclear anchorage protein 1-like [Photinus pyralis]